MTDEKDQASGEEGVEVIVLREAVMDDLKEFQAVLEEARIPSQIVSPPPEHCATCGPRLWLITTPDNAATAAATLEAHLNASLDENELTAVQTVTDLDGDEATCPGCLTTFATTESRCPECGLNFGA